ncbi:hypothetical protein R80B4_00877 [Fibrobacteres bacterium R8-0-B4]
MPPVNDVYEDARQEALKEFDEIDKSDVVNASLEFRLSNTSPKTNYEAWTKGSEQFADENYAAMSKWVH